MTRLIVIIHRGMAALVEYRLPGPPGNEERRSAPAWIEASDREQRRIDLASPSRWCFIPDEALRLDGRSASRRCSGPVTLLVPDGNWNQVKNMMRRVPMLSQAQPVV